MNQSIVIVGLGKMGSAFARNLVDKRVVPILFNRTHSIAEDLSTELGATSIMDLSEIAKIKTPRIVATFLPGGEATNEIYFGENGIFNHLNPGDSVIDFSNGHFSDDISRVTEFDQKEINYFDCGISGGPNGAQFAPCMMVGGKSEAFESIKELFEIAVSKGGGYQLVGDSGAGHFAKMVHNGIEYGMMQSIAEGFNMLKNSDYDFNLQKIADLYSKGSVIESKLIDSLKEGFGQYGDLSEFSGIVENTGTGQWFVEEAKKKSLDHQSIEAAVDFRLNSPNHMTFTGKILSVMRSIFGGHSIV